MKNTVTRDIKEFGLGDNNDTTGRFNEDLSIKWINKVKKK
jgi:hypothetical protein